VETGAAGVFYAISGYATKKAMPEAVYRELLMPFDRQILSALPEAAWFNVLHLCGSGIYSDLARELPIGALSFSTHNQGNPTLAEARERSGRAVMGGLDQRRTLMRGTADEIARQARQADSRARSLCERSITWPSTSTASVTSSCGSVAQPPVSRCGPVSIPC